jgi:hypothetical protein
MKHNLRRNGMNGRLVIRWAVVLGLVLLVAGCGESSRLEGKVVDGAGKPVAGIKIIASQADIPKDYHKLETLSGPDGTFALKGLNPSSEYVIEPWAQTWTTDAKLKVTTPPEGKTFVASPLVINMAVARNGGGVVTDLATGKLRFTVSADGVVTDSLTGLEWVMGPDKEINYQEAMAWVKSCNIAGGGWRMPKVAELRGLSVQGLGRFNMDPAFKLDFAFFGGEIWAEPRDAWSEWYFKFGVQEGGENWCYHNDCGSYRVVGVRFPTQRGPIIRGYF